MYFPDRECVHTLLTPSVYATGTESRRCLGSEFHVIGSTATEKARRPYGLNAVLQCNKQTTGSRTKMMSRGSRRDWGAVCREIPISQLIINRANKVN